MIICPNCGTQLNDDMLYCEKCGYEIKYVPEYEPQIEQSITETLSDIDLLDGEDSLSSEFLSDVNRNDNFEEFPSGDYETDYDNEFVDAPSEYADGEYEAVEYVDADDLNEEYVTEEFIDVDYVDEAGNSVEYSNGEFIDESYITDEYANSEYIDENYNQPITNGVEEILPQNHKKSDKSNNNKSDSNNKNSASKKKSNAKNPNKSSHKNGKNSGKKKNAGSLPFSMTLLPDISDKDEFEKAHEVRVRAMQDWINKKPSSRMSHSLSDTLYYEKYTDEDFIDEDDDFVLDPFDDFAYETIFFRWIVHIFKDKVYRWIAIGSILLIIIIFVKIGFTVSDHIHKNNSYEYQVELANKAALNGDYESAISYMENAIMLNSTDTSIKYTLAEYYFNNLEQEKGVLMLWEIIDSHDSNSTLAYTKLIEYYENFDDFEMIREILENCGDPSVTSQFQSYFANAPMFSFDEGIYEDAISLELTSDIPGTIYYTLDGTEPTTESNVYVAPIFLELGIYRITAMFVNDYGIQSQSVSKTYTIDIRVPYAPTVITEGGDYTEPELIEINVQTYCTVYYTTDGTIPNLQSNKYESPIPMPIGSSHFIFVAYSQEGVPGEPTEIDFNLTLDSDVDVNEISQKLMAYNYLTGHAADAEGHIAGNSTYYSYNVSSALKFEESSYYLFVETLVDSSGNVLKTGNYYLVDVEDGNIYKGVKDSENNILLSDLIDPSLYTLPDNPPGPDDNPPGPGDNPPPGPDDN